MAMDPLSDAKIIESWHRNALPWTNIVREGKIESRRLSTDQAIVNAILSCSPQTVLDIGCGEGWLVRELAAKNIRATGIDVVPALITQAKQEGLPPANSGLVSMWSYVTSHCLVRRPWKKCSEQHPCYRIRVGHSSCKLCIPSRRVAIIRIVMVGEKVHGKDSALILPIRHHGISERWKAGQNLYWKTDLVYWRCVSPFIPTRKNPFLLSSLPRGWALMTAMNNSFL